MELNLVWENVAKVAKFAFARSQSMTVEASIISSRGKEVLTIERGKLWIGRPTKVLRSWTTMPEVGVA
jgi:outer membrane lipoprotein-sorting protein